MHNLYFPWARIIIMLGMFYGMYYFSFYLDPKPVNYDLQEDDFVEYQERRNQLNSEVQYFRNGDNRGYGNLIALEPYLLPLDFYSEENFYNALRPLLEKAKSENAIDRKTLVVFPEHIGTGLVLLGEKKPAFFFKNVEQAIDYLLTRYREDLSEDEKDIEITFKYIIQKKSPEMSRVYQNTFSKLAIEFNVSIIAGSILVANPEIKKSELVSEIGDIYNASVTYIGTGKAITPIVKKVYLNTWESKVAAPGSNKQEFIVKVPAWTVGNLIGEDSLMESSYKSIGNTKIDGIVSPASSFVDPDWKNLLGSPPNSTETSDQLWIQSGIGRWIRLTRAKDHVQVFWKGELGNIIPGGETFTNQSSENLMKSGNKSGAKVMNLYF